jgi:hypothetical protein
VRCCSGEPGCRNGCGAGEKASVCDLLGVVAREPFTVASLGAVGERMAARECGEVMVAVVMVRLDRAIFHEDYSLTLATDTVADTR